MLSREGDVGAWVLLCRPRLAQYSAMCSVSIGWFVRGITPSVGNLVAQKCVLADFVTDTLSLIH